MDSKVSSPPTTSLKKVSDEFATTKEQIRSLLMIIERYFLFILHKNLCCGCSFESPRYKIMYSYIVYNNRVMPQKLCPLAMKPLQYTEWNRDTKIFFAHIYFLLDFCFSN